MVYSATETTCFDLYWSSSGFYNIKEEYTIFSTQVVFWLYSLFYTHIGDDTH